MFFLNLKALLEGRGHARPQSYLKANGFTGYTASRLINNNTTTISYDTLERLCLLCKCTPDDLFVWVPDEARPVSNDHPLQKLKAKPKVANPVERIKQLPPDKLRELQEFIDRLEKEG